MTSSIAATPAPGGSGSFTVPDSLAAPTPIAKQPDEVPSGTGTFFQPGEMSGSDSLGKSPDSSLPDQGLLLGGNVDLSRLASPGNKYLAAVENQRVVIRNGAGALVFQSPVQWEDGDTVQLTEWASGYQLLYVVKRSDGDLYEYMIDLALQQELKK